MAFLDWLPDTLRDADVDVYVMPGAETRSTWRSGLTPLGVVWHHTVTGENWADGHVAALLRDGRRDLAGPLSQVGVERDGTWVIVALGRANHNIGEWGNDSIGLEFYNDGTSGIWPGAQVESGVVGTAAVLNHLGRPASFCRSHKETDPSRKIDPYGLSMPNIRRRITAAMTNEDDDVDPATLVFLSYAAYFDREPEDLSVVARHAEYIERHGQDAFTGMLLNSAEGKALRKKRATAS